VSAGKKVIPKKLLIILVLLGFALIGGFIGKRSAGNFGTPVSLSEDWKIISPMRDAGQRDQQIGKGVHIVDGALTISQHVLYPSDTVLLDTEKAVAKVSIQLAENSETLVVSMGKKGDNFIFLSPGKIRMNRQGQADIAVSGRSFTLEESEGSLLITAGNTKVPSGEFTPSGFEMMTSGSQSRIEKIAFWDSNGEVLLVEEYTAGGKAPSAIWFGAMVGILFGFSFVQIFKEGIGGGKLIQATICFLLPLTVTTVPRESWLRLVEELYMTQTPGNELALMVLCLSCFPLLAVGMVASKVLSIGRVDRRGKQENDQLALILWALSVTAVTGLGTKGYTGFSLLWGLPVLSFLLLPATVMWRGEFRTGWWFVLDLPAILFMAVLGWNGGLLPALIWRGLVLASSARALLKWSPRPAADYFFVLILLSPISLETYLRSTYLSEAWDSTELGMEYAASRGWRKAQASWSGSCGSTSPANRRRLAFAGGSSAGGAYQFNDDPTAFFASQIHLGICTSLHIADRLQTANFGAADRNSFTIAKTIDRIIEKSQADVLLLYLGVNDLLSRRYKQSRKEREEVQLKRAAALNTLTGMGKRSVLITGASLPFRSTDDEGKNVAEVPIADAEENIRLIADSMKEQGKLILIAELIHSAQMEPLLAYQQMLDKVADDNEHVYSIDLRKFFADSEIDGMLADRNHLSREGNREVAGVLGPIVMRILGLQESAFKLPKRSLSTTKVDGMGEPVPFDSSEKLPPSSPASQGTKSAVQEMSQPSRGDPNMAGPGDDSTTIDNHSEMLPPFDENHLEPVAPSDAVDQTEATPED
jgi:hypothetical protein